MALFHCFLGSSIAVEKENAIMIHDPLYKSWGFFHLCLSGKIFFFVPSDLKPCLDVDLFFSITMSSFKLEIRIFRFGEAFWNYFTGDVFPSACPCLVFVEYRNGRKGEPLLFFVSLTGLFAS